MIAACALRVSPARLSATADFYRTHLGMREEVSSSGRELRAFDRSCAVRLRSDDSVQVAYSPGGNDIYWKIGLALDDVSSAAVRLRAGRPQQFLDIGFLTHLADPAGFCIELLQTTFESSAEERKLRLARPVIHNKESTLAQDYVIGQITTRITDPKRSLDFYQRILGMKLLSVQPVAPYRFTLYFLAYTEDVPPNADLEAVENREWLWQRDYTTLELQHRWDARPGSLKLPRKEEEGLAAVVLQLPPEQMRRLAGEGYSPGSLTDPDGLPIEVECL
mmetsp:Transcript_64668/g.152006  ORF Transcript_64668/g.152006 Transcript_64668/m.152006 type:complete len:277 (+) Transcript_64668:16-846(+)